MTREEHNLRRRIARQMRIAMRSVAGTPAPIDCCVMFQADVHLAATGIDPVAEWRGRYRTLRGMKRVMGPGGLPRCMARVARRMKWKRVSPARARVGDVGFVATPGGGLAVVRKLHRNEWIGRNETAWSVLPTDMVLKAWSIF